MSEARARKRVIAIASGGGHWIQLLRLREAFGEHDVTYVAADAKLESEAPSGVFYAVQDASREEPLLLLKSAFQLLRLVWRIRPDVVITTGAAPGLFGLVFGKLFGAKTIWIDSVANGEKMSMSGQLAKLVSDVVLTQWKHLAKPRGPRFEGSVL
jgi:UDP-N-acetylglucosamine:LPS N-acetylglucosamine transferase